MPDARPLVLTLGLDPDAFAALDRAHFPLARNYLPAHLTLFHALPGEHEEGVRDALAAAAARAPLPLTFAGCGRSAAASRWRSRAPSCRPSASGWPLRSARG